MTAPISKVINHTKKEWRGGKVRMRVLEPVLTTGKTAADVDKLLDSVRADMLKAFDELGQK